MTLNFNVSTVGQTMNMLPRKSPFSSVRFFSLISFCVPSFRCRFVFPSAIFSRLLQQTSRFTFLCSHPSDTYLQLCDCPHALPLMKSTQPVHQIFCLSLYSWLSRLFFCSFSCNVHVIYVIVWRVKSFSILCARGNIRFHRVFVLTLDGIELERECIVLDSCLAVIFFSDRTRKSSFLFLCQLVCSIHMQFA